MIPIFRVFSRDWDTCLDYSDDMLYEMYDHESRGVGRISPLNGFYQGKKFMNVTVAQWHEDMFSTIFPWDLYEDEKFPHWWLDRQFPHAKAWREAGMIP
jgi:hypothetical protein